MLSNVFVVLLLLLLQLLVMLLKMFFEWLELGHASMSWFAYSDAYSFKSSAKKKFFFLCVGAFLARVI